MAHLFVGALIGLGCYYLTDDKRALPLCMIGSILPDIIDKTLGLLFPAVLSSGRTIVHTLLCVCIILTILFVFLKYQHMLLGVGFACSILIHQICDEMWQIPSNWYYPVFGVFQGKMSPDYIEQYFWLEITNPSEWIFTFGIAIILVKFAHHKNSASLYKN